ncbi:MAG: hypothetical protein ACYDC8_14650 [Gammaproteobacteria bacterium]
MSMISSTQKRPFWAYTIGTLFLLTDYFLFTTGNPSCIFSLLGGLFFLHLLAIPAIPLVFWLKATDDRSYRKSFFLYLIVVTLFAAALFFLSDVARQHSIEVMDSHARYFLDNPSVAKVDVSDEGRKLAEIIGRQRYFIERETFVPTFRRMDYLVKTESGVKYDLVLTMTWKGTPQIWLRRVDSK